MPIFAMTGIDELIMKTPDALFNGEATVRLIESCCPYIKDAKAVPSIDIDVLLASIRLATFGEQLTITHTCKNPECKEINDYEIELQSLIDHYNNLTFDNKLVFDDLTIYLRPLNYGQLTRINIDNFTLKKMLNQLVVSENAEQRQENLDMIYGQMAENQVEVFLESIDYVQTPEEIVTDKEFIKEWVNNCDRDFYEKIKAHLELIKKTWSAPKHQIKCSTCEKEDTVSITLDQSHFFV